MSDSDLSFSVIGFPSGSVRGVEERLEPIKIDNALRRTVNAALVDFSDSAFQKYQVQVTLPAAVNTSPAALSGIWIGQQVTVDCVSRLIYEDTTAGAGERTAVPGSEITEGGFVSYRPRLTMLVVDWSIVTDEAGAAIGWTLYLEEV